MAGRRLASGWDALLDRLSTLDRTKWHDLHIWREWPAGEAIAIGQPFALRDVAPALVDLSRVYLDTVWPGGRQSTLGTAPEVRRRLIERSFAIAPVLPA